jgi:hypothetical protein
MSRAYNQRTIPLPGRTADPTEVILLLMQDHDSIAGALTDVVLHHFSAGDTGCVLMVPRRARVTAAVPGRGPTARSLWHGGPAQVGSGAGGLDVYGFPRAGPEGREGTMPADIGSARHAHRTQGAVTAASASHTPRQSRAVRRHHHTTMLYLAVGLLRDRRFREDALIGAITLAALAHLARESEARARARLAAWWDALPGPAGQAPANDRPRH